jgi:4'-phosphopantetheinyl transferase
MLTKHQIIDKADIIFPKLGECNLLAPDEIHVWQSLLDDSDNRLEYYTSILSDDERERSQRFKFLKHRNFYITGRAKLRIFISKYIAIEPCKIKFTYNKYGKPQLDKSPLKFNISHSQNKVIYSFNTENDIGVDIEVINKKIEINKLVNRFFSVSEAETINALDPKIAHNYFFRCWTRKEAFIKAHGQGLSLPLDQFQVSILQDRDVAIKNVSWDPESLHSWKLYSFTYNYEEICAVALNATERKKVKHFKL